ncbi:MAG: hypothetical protein ACJ0BK_01945 [Coraliomargaritaceae bacterium]
MRILIIGQFAFDWWSTHLGTELEIAQRHIDAGDQVTLLGCDSGIGSCRTNLQGNTVTCEDCVKLREMGISRLSGTYEYFKIGAYYPSEISKETIAELISSKVFDRASAENFVYEGHNLGLGAVSSLITESRDPNFDKNIEWFRLLSPLIESVLHTYLCVRSFLKTSITFDRAYVFNGRFDVTNGALRACQEIDHMDVFTHERGASIEKYMTFKNATPHDRNYLHRIAVSDWTSCADEVTRRTIGDKFYQRRLEGKDTSWKNFLDHQEDEVLPDEFDRRRRNIVIFNSSEDEFVGLGPNWENPIYESQSHGVVRIVRDALKVSPDMHFYLRMHPNLESVDNEDTKRLEDLAREGVQNFTFIPPSSDVSSYALMRASDAVLTFGSTIGVEATYWGKVSILAGHAFYEDFDATHSVNTHDEVMRMLADCRLKPKPKLGAIIFGYHMGTRGEKFKYLKAADLFNVRFKDTPLSIPKNSTPEEKVSFARNLERKLRPFWKKIISKLSTFLKLIGFIT